MTEIATSPSTKRWYVVHAYSGMEKSVARTLQERINRASLQSQFGQILVPVEEVVEVKGGKKSTKVRKLYPGYVFINMALYDEEKKVKIKPFYFVKDAAGVIGFVGGDHPAALRQAEIDEIKARIEAASGKEVPKVTFEVGEEVKITDGAFANLTGRVDEVDPARGKLKISVSIFGRFTPVELEYWQVQRASES